MTVIRLKFIKAYNSKGRTYHYFRRGAVNIPLPGRPGSAEFNEAYAMALDANGATKIGAGRNVHGSISALIGLYGETSHFLGLAPRTRQQQLMILNRFRAEHGTRPVSRIERKHMTALLAKLKPCVAVNWAKALKPLFAYGVEIEWLKVNPLKDIKLHYKGGDGFTPWTEVEIAAFRARHALGSMPRLGLELLLGTCMRSVDVIALGPANIWNGKLTLRTKKTGAVLTLPVLPELKAAIDAMPTSGGATFLINSLGRPFKQRDWNVQFARWVAEAGIDPQFRPHGLRHAGLTRLANAGASPHQIQAWSGQDVADFFRALFSLEFWERLDTLDVAVRQWCAWNVRRANGSGMLADGTQPNNSRHLSAEA
jgi:integrase